MFCAHEQEFTDVAQNITQEPIFCYSRQVHIGGPLNAYWAKEESLGPDTYCGILPRDHKYLSYALETTNIFLEMSDKA